VPAVTVWGMPSATPGFGSNLLLMLVLLVLG
jgi:hypothetical protein